MKALILSAGLGTRLGNLTKRTPKCLVSINGKNLLQWQLEMLKDAGCNDITVVIGAKGECWNQDAYNRIKLLHSNIIINFNNTSSENTFSLKLALDETGEEDFLSIDGDVIFSKEVLAALINSKSDIALVSKEAEDPEVAGSKVVCDANGRVLELGKKITPKTFPWNIHSGLIKVSQNKTSILKKMSSTEEAAKRDTGVLLNEICKSNHVQNLTYSEKDWVNVNTIEERVIAEKILRGAG